MWKSSPILRLSASVLAVCSTAAAEASAPLQEYAQRLAAGTPVRIGLYGASTYAGVWTSDGASGKTQQGVGYWMQYFLNAYYMNAAAVVDNSAAVPGSTTNDFVTQWPGMMASTSNQIVVIGWGANDCTKMTAGEYRFNLTLMVNTARDAGRTPILDTPHQMTAAAGTTNTESIKQFAEVMRQVARQLTVPLIDSQDWSDTLWRTNVNLRHWISDGMHLNQDGLRAKGALMASSLIGTYPRINGGETISTELPEWRVSGDVSRVAYPATRYAQALSGRNFRLAFYASRPGLDLYIATPVFKDGGEVEVKVDGKDIGRKLHTLNADMDTAKGFSVDVDTMVAEDMPPGFHVVELNTPAPSVIYYARFSESRAASLALASSRSGTPSPGFARHILPLNYTIRKAEADEGVVLTEIPVSNHLRDVSVEVSARFAAEEGIVLFASGYGTDHSAGAARGGLYVYLNAGGYLNVREWGGESGYTRAVQMCDDKLDSTLHTFTVDVSRAGNATVFVDGGMKGVYNMTVPRTGGFLGFYKRVAGTMRVPAISIY